MLASTCLKKGDGIPLVFLHGMFGVCADWESVVSYLPPCECIGVDLPGHGLSPFTDQFCDAFPDFDRIHLIGYSMGGRLALAYAERFPEKIASLTLASTHLGIAEEEEKRKRWDYDLLLASKIETMPIDLLLKSWYDQPIFAGFCPSLEKRRLQDQSLLARALKSYSLAKQKVYRAEGALQLVGERDVKFRGLYPKAMVISRSGHMVHLENPKEFAQILKTRIF